MYRARSLARARQARPLLAPGKADLIPVEILSEIFLLIAQGWSRYRRDLMLVCWRWHAIIISTPGIHSQLTIRRATRKEVVQVLIQGRTSRLHVRVDVNDEKDGSDFDAENFNACFMAAAGAASRWSSLSLISPPPHGEYKALQILQPLVHLECFKLACGFSEFLEPLMIAINTSASPILTTMQLEDPAAVLYLAQPAWLQITNSLTTLIIQLSKKMDSPVDILPHLHKLGHFEARNLCLPFYPPNTFLPLIHTLRFLNLKAVSVQWMAGHVFPVLEKCEITFPRHAGAIQALQPVTMPSCVFLTYNSNDLRPLTQFHLTSLHELYVKSGQWNVRKGNPHLASLYPVVTAGAKSLTELRLDVECSEQLLVYMLSLVPALKRLWLGLTRPNALCTTFFQAFIVREPKTDDAPDMLGPPSEVIPPLCPSLTSLHLHHRRWLRGPDKKAIIMTFGDIMTSRNLEIHGSFNLILSFDKAPKSSWSIGQPVRKSKGLGDAEFILGISVPYGKIPISTALPRNGVVALPLKEAEYLRLRQFYVNSSFEFLFIHDHMELMVYDYHRPPLPTSLPCALPLFYALRVLVVEDTNPSFLAGHTFQKLERCKVVRSLFFFGASPRPFTETEMPVCTRVDIDDPYLLATFKLPQIRELALDFSDPNRSIIWEKHIAMNASLSRLTLLHIKKWPFHGHLVPILRSLPLLQTLIISSRLGMDSLTAFLPIEANGTSKLKQTSGEGQTITLLCPRLRSLRIEGQHPSVEPALIPILGDIIILRIEHGSPLENFTFSWFRPKPGSQIELIGKNGSPTMEKFALPEEAKKFELVI
jgi:hypothetical protein